MCLAGQPDEGLMSECEGTELSAERLHGLAQRARLLV